MDFQEVNHLPVEQRGEALCWNHVDSKKKWRRFASKPTREVRRFAKEKGGQGKGGKRAIAFLATPEVQSYFKGKGKRKGRSSGKGFGGGRTNPTGPDGLTMKCSICNSEEHFRARCPQAPSPPGQRSFNAYASTLVASSNVSPLSGLTGHITHEESIHFMVREPSGAPSGRNRRERRRPIRE